MYVSLGLTCLNPNNNPLHNKVLGLEAVPWSWLFLLISIAVDDLNDPINL